MAQRVGRNLRKSEWNTEASQSLTFSEGKDLLWLRYCLKVLWRKKRKKRQSCLKERSCCLIFDLKALKSLVLNFLPQRPDLINAVLSTVLCWVLRYLRKSFFYQRVLVNLISQLKLQQNFLSIVVLHSWEVSFNPVVVRAVRQIESPVKPTLVHFLSN